MKKIFTLFSLLVLFFTKSFCLNITIIESQSYNAGHVMDVNWQNVATGMGNTATISPQTTLDNTAFFATTDILIVSSGVITLTAAGMANITAYIQQGGRAYIQGEYDCSAYNTNSLFENMVAQFGGGPFNYMGIIAGTLAPMNVLGALSTTNNAVSSISYYWYGCHGVPGSCSIVEPFLEFGGQYFGFVYCPPNTNGGRVIQTTDQDWVNQNTSNPLMENIITNLASNSYNCSTSTSLGVNLGPDISACNGQPVNLDAGTGANYSYLWSNGATTQTITVNSTGTYWVDVTNGNCSASDTINISLANPFSVNLGNDTLICNGQSVTLDAGNTGLNYVWNTNAVTQTISVNTSGSFWVTVSNGTCSVTDTINIAFQSSPQVSLGNDTLYCSAFNRLLNATNAGANYNWSTGSTASSININSAGTYWVIVSNSCGNATDTIVITQNLLPVSLLGVDTLYCNSFSSILTGGTNASSYLWSDGSTDSSITVSSPGTYGVQLTNICGSVTDSIIILQSIPPTVDLGNDTIYCGSFIQSYNVSCVGCVYSWSDGNSNAQENITSPGIITVTVSNGCGVATDTVNIEQSPSPFLTMPQDTFICNPDGYVLVANSSPGKILWSTGDSTLDITIHRYGSFVATLISPCGNITDSVLISECPGEYILPNAFSPNNDSRNDFLTPIRIGNAKLLLFEVYNRWGQLMFTSNLERDGWDGTFNDAQCSIGVYVYLMKYSVNSTGEIILKKGNATLLR